MWEASVFVGFTFESVVKETLGKSVVAQPSEWHLVGRVYSNSFPALYDTD